MFCCQIVKHPDAQKAAVSCGLFYNRTLWCGCGRYLVGVDARDYLIKHYKPIKDDVEITSIAACLGHVWVSFREKSTLVLFNAAVPGSMEMLDCL